MKSIVSGIVILLPRLRFNFDCFDLKNKLRYQLEYSNFIKLENSCSHIVNKSNISDQDQITTNFMDLHRMIQTC
ncbi:hypothetical protein MtrunA17_Chr6g0461341 [Medicago truncatula]|uniref:Uncharacterized protein n=1 Tax=Medicago truncatula TaxID=3880 RepID=A0A396HDX9_MEDTR|nr:hypothetical protein MtrunA17_Chr6g0461341 [Medicago truncatula]